ncbi:MAG TPA: hypothetical protein VGN72_06570 [Tepidisphaeraceae bacterium]|jgi:hypothetical protein|nr:hypothetical protein [Tepidisphaeraceae bacterium]
MFKPIPNPYTFHRSLMGSIHYDTPDEGGESQGENKPAGKPVEPPKADDTDAKIAAAIAAERTKWEKAAADKAAADKAERDRKEAEAKGEWEKVATDERTKRESLERDLAQERHDKAVDREIAVYLADPTRKDYAGVAERYVRPTLDLQPGADQSAIAKAVKAACDQYIKDNPRPSGFGGTPGSHGHKAPAGSNIPRRTNGYGGAASVASSRF